MIQYNTMGTSTSPLRSCLNFMQIDEKFVERTVLHSIRVREDQQKSALSNLGSDSMSARSSCLSVEKTGRRTRTTETR